MVNQSYEYRQLLSTRPAAKPNHEVNSLVPNWTLSSNFPYWTTFASRVIGQYWVRSGSFSSHRFGSGVLHLFGSGLLLVRFGSVVLHRFGSGALPRVGSGVISPPARASVPIRALVLHMLLSDPSSCLHSDPSSSIRSDPSSASVAFLFAIFPQVLGSDPIGFFAQFYISDPSPLIRSDPNPALFLKLFQQVFTPFDDVFDHSNY